jgi:biotin operon repressor
MSVAAMSWAWQQDCPTPTAKLVLLKLADNANDAGECWPSLATIARHCGVERNTVWRVIRQLAERGLVRVEHRCVDGVALPNRYRLALTVGGVYQKSPPSTSDIQGVYEKSPPGVYQKSTKPSESEPSDSPPIIPPKGERARPRQDPPEGWAEWYAAFPHKVGKRTALIAYRKALQRAPPAQLIAGLERYIASKPPDQAWCHPATWLNGDRWLDQPAARRGPTPAAPLRPIDPNDRAWLYASDAELAAAGRYRPR